MNILDKAADEYVQETKQDVDEVAALEFEAEQMLKIEAYFMPKLCTSWLDNQFPRIDLSFLAWTESDKTPSFAIFDLDNPICTINYHTKDRILGMHPMWKKYQYGLKQLLATAAEEHGVFDDISYNNDMRYRSTRDYDKRPDQEEFKKVSLSCKFPGRIPRDVREKITEIGDKYRKISTEPFDRWDPSGQELGRRQQFSDVRFECQHTISIITEAPEWELNVEAEIENLDPLVILSACGENWLIEKFDVTPMENIAAREFSVKHG